MKTNKKMLFLLAVSMLSPWQLANAGWGDIDFQNSASSSSSVESDSGSSNISASDTLSSGVADQNCSKTIKENNVLKITYVNFLDFFTSYFWRTV